MRSISRRRAKAWSRPTNGSWSSAVVSIKHPSTLPAESHRSPDALAGQLDGRAAWLDMFAVAARQDRLGVMFDLLGDLLESSRLAAAVVLHGGANHATCIGDEVGHYQDASAVECGLCFCRRGDVRPLHNE